MKKPNPWLLLFLIFPSLSVCWAGGPQRTSTPEGEFLRYANGRSELVIHQTALGGILGAILGDAIDRKVNNCNNFDNYEGNDCDSGGYSYGTRAGAGAILGAGAGVGASLLLTRDGYFDAGRAMVINFAGEWGAVNGFLLFLATNIKEDSNQELLTFSTGLGAILGSAVLTRDKTYYSGNVGFAKSGALWGALIPYGIYRILEKSPKDESASWILLVGGNLGLVSMAYIAPKLDWSRRKSIWLDVGGIVGVGAGIGLGALFDPDNDQTIAAGGVFGSLVGLSIAAMLNQNNSSPKAQPGAETAVNSLFWKEGSNFGLGLPVPQLTTKRMGEKVGVETQITLVNVIW